MMGQCAVALAFIPLSGRELRAQEKWMEDNACTFYLCENVINDTRHCSAAYDLLAYALANARNYELVTLTVDVIAYIIASQTKQQSFEINNAMAT